MSAVDATLLLLFGAVTFVAGVLQWSGRWRSWTTRPNFGRVGFATLPGSFGFVLLGLAGFTGWVGLADAGLAVVFGSFLFLLWQPSWMAPRWYRERPEAGSHGATTLASTWRAFRDAARAVTPPPAEEGTLRLEANRFLPGGALGRKNWSVPGWLGVSTEALAFNGTDAVVASLPDSGPIAIPLADIEAVTAKTRDPWARADGGDAGRFLPPRLIVRHGGRTEMFAVWHPYRVAREIRKLVEQRRADPGGRP